MTRDEILKQLLLDSLAGFLEECQEHAVKAPIHKKNESEFVFKNGKYSTDHAVLKNDYAEFLTRQKVQSLMIENIDFKDVQDVISSYENVKRFYKMDAKNMVDIFILNYMEDTKSLEFNKTQFNRLFREMIQFIKSEIHKVYCFTPVFNTSSPHSIAKTTSIDITLSQISPQQFKIIKEHLVGKASHTPGFMYNLKYVLETTISSQSNFNAENDLISKRFHDFIVAALLFAPGDVRIGPIYRNFTRWTRNSGTAVGTDNHKFGPRRYVLRRSTKNNLLDFYMNYIKLNLDTKDWSFVRIAIDRFVFSTSRDNLVDRLVDLNVSLECMFSSAGETSMKIANRTASLIGGGDDTQERCWNFIRNEYKLRNDVLHGRSSENKLDVNMVNELEDIVRTCIRLLLNMSKNLSKEDLKKQGMLLGGKTMRDYILDALDVGLLNRSKMKMLSDNAHGVFIAARKSNTR